MESEELPILKGILKGVVSYHNARRCHNEFSKCFIYIYFFIHDCPCKKPS